MGYRIERVQVYVLAGFGVAMALLIASTSRAAATQDIVLYGATKATIGWSTPPTGTAHGYAVYVSRDGGPESVDQVVTSNRATIAGAPGERVVARVRAYGFADGGSSIMASDYSPSTAIRFEKATSWQSSAVLGLHCGVCQTLELRGASNLGAAIRFAAPGAPWRLVDVGPIEPVGIDALWQDEASGALVVARLGPSLDVRASALLLPGDPSEAVRLAEIDGDPAREILLVDRESGEIQVREFSNGHLARTGSVWAPTSWSFAGSADFDGDGISELWWQRAPSGTIEVWKATRYGLTSRVLWMETGAQGDIAEIADLNGDGWQDVVWRTSAGVLTISYLGEAGLERNLVLPAGPEDDRLEVRGIAALQPGGRRHILVQHRDTSAVGAIFPELETFAYRPTLFHVSDPLELRYAY